VGFNIPCTSIFLASVSPGPSWENISVDAKDLVARMLSVNPRDRISAGDILSHAWLMKAATAAGPSEQDTSHIMGEQYSLRIKRLVLRSKFKRCFVDDCLQIAHLERKRSFQSELPFLDTENVTANPHDFGIRYVISGINQYCICLCT
jgi:serine/threonine protein kinase